MTPGTVLFVAMLFVKGPPETPYIQIPIGAFSSAASCNGAVEALLRARKGLMATCSPVEFNPRAITLPKPSPSRSDSPL